jgi:ferredoxin
MSPGASLAVAAVRGGPRLDPGARLRLLFAGEAHTPERLVIEVDSTVCTACAECVDACPTSALRAAGGAHLVAPALCDACGQCLPVCGPGALRLVQQETAPFDPAAVALRKEKLARLLSLGGGRPGRGP